MRSTPNKNPSSFATSEFYARNFNIQYIWLLLIWQTVALSTVITIIIMINQILVLFCQTLEAKKHKLISTLFFKLLNCTNDKKEIINRQKESNNSKVDNNTTTVPPHIKPSKRINWFIPKSLTIQQKLQTKLITTN